MKRRTDFKLNVNPIDNGYMTIIKYHRKVVNCYCEDEASVNAAIAEHTELWKSEAEEFAAEDAEREAARVPQADPNEV